MSNPTRTVLLDKLKVHLLHMLQLPLFCAVLNSSRLNLVIWLFSGTSLSFRIHRWKALSWESTPPSPCADMENLRRGEQQQDCPGIEQRRHQLHWLDTARKGGAAGGGVLQNDLQRMHTKGISGAISWCEWVYELSLTLWPSWINTIINLIYVWFGHSTTMVLSG